MGGPEPPDVGADAAAAACSCDARARSIAALRMAMTFVLGMPGCCPAAALAAGPVPWKSLAALLVLLSATVVAGSPFLPEAAANRFMGGAVGGAWACGE